jgi:hypothetical protein
MPISTITNLVFRDQFQTAHGEFYCYEYQFEDSTLGEANHKAEPSWGVGDEVEYVLNGQTPKGMLKLKVGKVGSFARPAAPSRHSVGPSRPSAPRATSSPSPRPSGPHSGPLGVTVGMALNNAGLDARLVMDTNDVENHEVFSRWLWERASVYLRVAAALESGKLSKAGSHQAPAEPVSQIEAELDEAPLPEPPRPSRPSPGPSGQAFAQDTDDNDEVPF